MTFCGTHFQNGGQLKDFPIGNKEVEVAFGAELSKNVGKDARWEVFCRLCVEASAPLGIGVLGTSPLRVLLNLFLEISPTKELSLIFQDRIWPPDVRRVLFCIRLLLGGSVVGWDRVLNGHGLTDSEAISQEELETLASQLLDTYMAHPSVFLDLEVGPDEHLHQIARLNYNS